MPERGIIKCLDIACGKEFEGELPNNKEPGFEYIHLGTGHREINIELVNMLIQHHVETRIRVSPEGRSGGHDEFEVFLPEGRKGRCIVSSYFVNYKELGEQK